MSQEQLQFTTLDEKFQPTDGWKRGFESQELTPEMMAGLVEVLPDAQTQPISLQTEPLAGGFNTEITGGGLYRLQLEDERGQKSEPVILKSVPPFAQQQAEMFQVLEDLGELEFIQLLSAYPSNHLSNREIQSYAFLSEKVPLRLPRFFLGVLNQLNEQAWIFMEDISWLVTSVAEIRKSQMTILEHVVTELAKFHSQFWQKTDELESQEWLGRWWTEQNSDFLAEDVTSYALHRCAELHPTLLDQKRLKIVLRALKKRPEIQARLAQQPQTVIHWDFGPHNVKTFVSGNKVKPIVFDWELTSIGFGGWDLAQFILPQMSVERAAEVEHLIQHYLASLSSAHKNTIQVEQFIQDFDLVVMEHFFRVCGPVLFGGSSIDPVNPFFIEWQNCLKWIEARSYKWL